MRRVRENTYMDDLGETTTILIRDDQPPVRANVVIGVSGLTAQNDTCYIDCPGLSIPDTISRVTVIGDKMPGHPYFKAWDDVWIQGHSRDRLMNCGPRSDGNDFIQVKTWNGVTPEDITLRYVNFHDLTRPEGSSAHPDGIQVMAARRFRVLSCRFERVDVQPIFFSPFQGAIEDCLVEDCDIERPPNGFYSVNIVGGAKNVLVRDCRVGANVHIDSASWAVGCRVENMRDLDCNPISGLKTP